MHGCEDSWSAVGLKPSVRAGSRVIGGKFRAGARRLLGLMLEAACPQPAQRRCDIEPFKVNDVAVFALIVEWTHSRKEEVQKEEGRRNRACAMPDKTVSGERGR